MASRVKLKACLVVLVGFAAGLLIAGLIMAAHMGAFTTVELARERRGPYRIVCLPHQGPHNRIGEKILRVEDLLKDESDRLGLPCAIFYDDPSQVAEHELRARGGYVVKGAPALGPLPAELRVERIGRRDVVVATFEGHANLAPRKIYPALRGWLAEHKCDAAGPSIEFYRKGVVECELPVRPAAGGTAGAR
jgi:DNA gyrase inhibitor GyrI